MVYTIFVIKIHEIFLHGLWKTNKRKPVVGRLQFLIQVQDVKVENVKAGGSLGCSDHEMV